MTPLSESELKILEFLRSGEFESIKIRFVNKRINHIELEKFEDVKKRIVNILNQNRFQNIDIRQQDGRVCRITTKIKIKFDEQGKITDNNSSGVT